MEDVLVLPLIHPHHIGEINRITTRGREEGLEELKGGDDTELADHDQELVDRPWVSVGEAKARGSLRGGKEGGREGGEGWRDGRRGGMRR